MLQVNASVAAGYYICYKRSCWKLVTDVAGSSTSITSGSVCTKIERPKLDKGTIQNIHLWPKTINL